MKDKRLLLITPSVILARGLEKICREHGEFEVDGVLRDLSPGSERLLRGMDADLILLDIQVLDYNSRKNGKNLISANCDSPVAILQTCSIDDETLRAYDGAIGIYDDPTEIVRKMRNALQEERTGARPERETLSSREKEILVAVAKGMINKEIADQYNISIHTVITHRKNITRKTGIKTVAGLTVYALLNNLLDVNSFD